MNASRKTQLTHFFIKNVLYSSLFVAVFYKICAYLYDVVINDLYEIFRGDMQFILSSAYLFRHFVRDANVQNGDSILLIGCGTGIFLTHDSVSAIIKQKKLHIECRDSRPSYIERCQSRIQQKNMSTFVSSITVSDAANYVASPLLQTGTQFRHIVFLETAPILHQDPAQLVNCLLFLKQNALKADGRIVFLQNLTDNPHWLLHLFKSLVLPRLTTVPFGCVMCLQDLQNIASKIKMSITTPPQLISGLTSREVAEYFSVRAIYTLISYMMWIRPFRIEQFQIVFCQTINR